MKKAVPKQQTEAYNILFNVITDAGKLIKQGAIEQAQSLLIRAQRQTEDLCINSNDSEKYQSRNLALGMGITKDYIYEKLTHAILNHDTLDSEIRDKILDEEVMNYVKLTHGGYDNKTREEIRDEFEDHLFYKAMYQVFNSASEFYFQLGLYAHEVMILPPVTVSLHGDTSTED